ncbi:MAG: putative ATP-grasp-modified RiPP [Pseudonocardiaceae bacterium]|nr:putative ATP-grasp-modified RiPP [Pseudonocardiaceae bacterium]
MTTRDPLGGTAALFPLARYPATDSAEDARPVVRPFGVRYAVVPEPARTCPVVDFSAWSYDPVRQIAVVHEVSPTPCRTGALTPHDHRR